VIHVAPWAVRMFVLFFFSSRRRHTRFDCDWSSDVCSSDLTVAARFGAFQRAESGGNGSRSKTSRKAWPNRPVSSARTNAASSTRSEERRVGKECRARWARAQEEKKTRRSANL